MVISPRVGVFQAWRGSWAAAGLALSGWEVVFEAPFLPLLKPEPRLEEPEPMKRRERQNHRGDTAEVCFV